MLTNRVRQSAKPTSCFLATIIALLLGVGKLSAQQTSTAFSPDVNEYNLVVGTQNIGPKYKFTSDDLLIEPAKRMVEMGSNICKITFGKTDYGFNITADSKYKLLLHPSYQQLLSMPELNYYFLWAYTLSNPNWRDGLSVAEYNLEYREMYDLAYHLMTTYTGLNKTFYLGHWEGDWHLTNTNSSLQTVDPVRIQGMIDWLNCRQAAIDDARSAALATGVTQVNVFHYTEVNRVFDALDKGYDRIVNKVLPYANVDYVSYSSYDACSGIDDDEAMTDKYTRAMNYIEQNMMAKPSIVGKRVFIGEYGFASATHAEQTIDRRTRLVMKAGLRWGTPFILFWEMYNNEIDANGNQTGFWLIDDQNVKRKAWDTHNRFLISMKNYIQEYKLANGTLPTARTFCDKGVEVIDEMNQRDGGTTYFVRNNPAVGEYGKLSTALSLCMNGDTIDVLGTFTELDLKVNQSVVIRGHGRNATIIQGNSSDIPYSTTGGYTGKSIFYIGSGVCNHDITISNLTLRRASSGANGGAVYIQRNKGSVTLSNILFAGNRSNTGGGAVATDGCKTLSIENCYFYQNSSGSGGAIRLKPNNDNVQNGTSQVDVSATIRNCTFAENRTQEAGNGGALWIDVASMANSKVAVSLVNTTIYNNVALRQGGAIYAKGAVGNQQTGFPIPNSSSYATMRMTLNHCTIVNNKSEIENTGGVYSSDDGAGSMLLKTDNSILLNNLGATVLGAQIGGSTRLVNLGQANSFFTTLGTWFASGGTSINNTQTGAFAPLLFASSLSNDPVPVLAINQGSSAINYVQNNQSAAVLTTDARGYSRDALPDAGAFEYGGVATDFGNLEVEMPKNERVLLIGNRYLQIGENCRSINVYGMNGASVSIQSADGVFDVGALPKGCCLVSYELGGTRLVTKLVK